MCLHRARSRTSPAGRAPAPPPRGPPEEMRSATTSTSLPSHCSPPPAGALPTSPFGVCGVPHGNPSPATLAVLSATLRHGHQCCPRDQRGSPEAESLSRGPVRLTAARRSPSHPSYQVRTPGRDLRLIACTVHKQTVARYTTYHKESILYELISTKKEYKEICSGSYFTVRQFSET